MGLQGFQRADRGLGFSVGIALRWGLGFWGVHLRWRLPLFSFCFEYFGPSGVWGFYRGLFSSVSGFGGWVVGFRSHGGPQKKRHGHRSGCSPLYYQSLMGIIVSPYDDPYYGLLV